MRTLAIAFALALTACSHGNPREAAAGGKKNVTVKEGPCEPMRAMPAAKDHGGHDFDQDGHVSRDEYLCHAVKRFNEMEGEDEDRHLSGEELKKSKAARRIADRNRDKKISILEFMQSADREFKAADKDRNGKISRNEFHQQLP